jgi:hypothetical protein
VGGAAVRNARIPRLTPTLSAAKVGEGDISATRLAVRSEHALALTQGWRTRVERIESFQARL